MSPLNPEAERRCSEFQALPGAVHRAFLDRLVQDRTLRREFEGHLDLANARERSAEPARPLRNVEQRFSGSSVGVGQALRAVRPVPVQFHDNLHRSPNETPLST